MRYSRLSRIFRHNKSNAQTLTTSTLRHKKTTTTSKKKGN
jgi:hypothetical protein